MPLKRDDINLTKTAGTTRGKHVRYGDSPNSSKRKPALTLRKNRGKHCRHGKQTAGQYLSTSDTSQSENPRKHSTKSQQNSLHYLPEMSSCSTTNKKSKVKKIAIIICSILLALILAITAAGAIYVQQLNTALSPDDKTLADVNTVTSQANLNEPFYLLVLGSDSREGSGTSNKAAESGDQQRADVIMLLRVDATKGQITMLSVPRDTPYTHPDGSITKINETYNIGGAACTIKAVSELCNVPISYYAEIHFSELQEIIDSLGGIEVDVDIELSYKDALTGEKITIEPGRQVLNGQEAQIFSRARKEYVSDQDQHRQDNIRQLASAIIRKVLDRPVTQLPETILNLAEFVNTNITTQDIISVGFKFVGSGKEIIIYSAKGPSDGDIRPETNNLWLCYDNPKGWEILMEAIDSGQDPSNIDVEEYAIR